MTLQQLNQLSDLELREALGRCCGARAWVEQVAGRRPFESFDQLLIAADEAFALLEQADWLEAFSHHPKIGDVESLRAKFTATATWASGEQSAVQLASDEEIDELARRNEDYLRKFGYIFIICATGKSAGEMLQRLIERLENDPDSELPVAATEQMKITHLRLHKLIEPT